MKKKRYIWVCLIVAFLISISGLSSQVQSADKVPPGRVAAQLIGWSYQVDNETGTMGYFTFIEGIPEVFEEDVTLWPPEEKAFFTFKTTPEPGTVVWGDVTRKPGYPLKWVQYGPRLIEMWYDTSHNQNICDPYTFADGEHIATFKITNLLSIYVPLGELYPEIGYEDVVRDIMSAELVDSVKFEHRGESYDFKALVPNGVTINTFGAGLVHRHYCPPPGASTQMFGGSAIAIGGKK